MTGPDFALSALLLSHYGGGIDPASGFSPPAELPKIKIFAKTASLSYIFI